MEEIHVSEGEDEDGFVTKVSQTIQKNDAYILNVLENIVYVVALVLNMAGIYGVGQGEGKEVIR